jgi:hypothetical protein
MAEPSLQEIFGPGATQTATTITIVKADIAGLTPAVDNKAEPLWVGIFNNASATLTQARQDANPEQSIVIRRPEFNASQIIPRDNKSYRQNIFEVLLQALDKQTAIIPDDY